MDIKPRRSRPAPKHQEVATKKPAKSASTRGLLDDISVSLNAIDDEGATQSKKPKNCRKNKKHWTKKKKTIVITIVSLLSLIILAIGYVGVRLSLSGGQMFNGNPLIALFSNQDLKRDDNGRSNVLIFGTSEDDPGHSGATLADSIMVLSVDQDTKDAVTISIPRDLWVSYDTPCSIGEEGKINAAYSCALSASSQDETVASLEFAKKVGKVVGLDIQYYAKVNYSFVRESVDALGGIDVTIDSRDSRGIYDVNTGLKLPNGQSFINGEQALDLARARGSSGGYGLEQSNFDREKNQQAVLRAIQQKAVSGGTLANPLKALNLVDSLSANIKTNVESTELRAIIETAAGMQSNEIASLPLNSTENPLVTTGTYNSQSIVRPIKGLFDYSDIQSYIEQSL